MSKGERISQLVEQMGGEKSSGPALALVDHPYYRAFFQCWNEQRYYEAHDVLEQVWLTTDSEDGDFFKGLIQGAGAFVHLQKNYEHPSHPKHGRRLRPAVRLFRLSEKYLTPYAPVRHAFDVAGFLVLLQTHRQEIVESDFVMNPWTPETAPKLRLDR